MSLWSWFFPTPADRVNRARAALGDKSWAAARAEVEDIESPEADDIRRLAEDGLAAMNLDLAMAAAQVGDDNRVRHHLELAERFLSGDGEDRVIQPSTDEALKARLRDVRREVREQRSTRDAEAAKKRAEKAASQQDPGLVATRMGAQGGLETADEAREARLALVLENYPKDLRRDLERLGGGFVSAIEAMDEGRPDLALQALDGLPEHPLVAWEGAVAALGLGDMTRAIRELRTFERLVGGHRAIGNEHSGALLAELLARTGEIDAALETLIAVRKRDPKVGGLLLAQLLEAKGRLPEAEGVLRELMSRDKTDARIASTLARVRVAGGHRVEAMAALEQQISACCSTPGKCGKPPDPQVQRDLAILYFEDRRDLPRARELADTVARSFGAQGPTTWEDHWMMTLWAQDRGEEGIADAFERLWHALQPGDPRRDMVLARLEALG